MNAEEATARAHKVEKCRLLDGAHRNFTGCIEHHSAVPVELSGREFRQVFRCDHFKGTRILSKLDQDCLRKRYDIVPIAGRVCEVEDTFWRTLCPRVERSDDRRAADECDELASRHNPLPPPS